jgi:hypothetical protein
VFLQTGVYNAADHHLVDGRNCAFDCQLMEFLVDDSLQESLCRAAVLPSSNHIIQIIHALHCGRAMPSPPDYSAHRYPFTSKRHSSLLPDFCWSKEF